MNYDYTEKKIVMVLASNIDHGVALNVIGHMAVALGAYGERDLMGRPELLDASATRHVGIARYPFDELARALLEAKEDEMEYFGALAYGLTTIDSHLLGNLAPGRQM